MLFSEFVNTISNKVRANYPKLLALFICSIYVCIVFEVSVQDGRDCIRRDIDCSWVMDMQNKLHHGQLSGRDFFFTYGPLAQLIFSIPRFLFQKSTILNSAPYLVVGTFVVAITLLNINLLALPQIDWRGVIASMLIFGSFAGLLNLKAIYGVSTVILLTYTFTSSSFKQRTILACGVAIFIFLGQLFSFDVGLYSFGLIFGFLILTIIFSLFKSYVQPIVIDVREALRLFAISVSTLLILNLLTSLIFKLTSQNYQGFFDYQYYSFQIAKSYNYVMSSFWEPDITFTSLIFGIAAYSIITYLLRIKELSLFEMYCYAGLIGLSCISWKSAVVRSDNIHVVSAVYPLFFLFLVLGFSSLKRHPLQLPAIVLYVLIAVTWPYPTRHTLEYIAETIADDNFLARLRRSFEFEADTREIVPPELEQALRPDTLLLNYPHENIMSVAIDRSNLAPFLQPYAATNDKLQEKYVELIAPLKSQTEVIYCADSPMIDNVMDLARSPRIFDYLLSEFQLKHSEPYAGCVVLEPRQQSRTLQFKPISFTQTRDEQSWHVQPEQPAACTMLRANIEISYPSWSLLGRPTPLTLEMEVGNYHYVSRQIVPLDTAHPFWTNIYLQDYPDTYHLFDDSYHWQADPLISGFRIRPTDFGHFDVDADEVTLHKLECLELSSRYEAPAQTQIDLPSDTIIANALFEQEFIAEANGLEGITIKVGTYARVNPSTLELTLREAESGLVLAHELLDASAIRDGAYVRLIMPSQPDSAGKRYVLSLSSPDATPDTGVAVWMKSGDPYKQGRFLVNGSETTYDLFFMLLYSR
jgi:hypothetical protein